MFIPNEGSVGESLNQSRQLYALGLSLIAVWLLHDGDYLGEIEIGIK